MERQNEINKSNIESEKNIKIPKFNLPFQPYKR